MNKTINNIDYLDENALLNRVHKFTIQKLLYVEIV